MKYLFSRLVLLAALVSLMLSAGYSLAGEPHQAFKINQPSDKRIKQLREFTKQQRLYDKKLENQDYPNGYVTCICSSESQNVLMVVKNGDQLYISRDGGKTWRTGNKGIPKSSGKIADIIKDEKRKYFYAATDNGVYRSSDAGRSWHRFSEGLPYEHRTDGITPMVLKLSLDHQTGDIYSRVALDGFGIYKTGCNRPEWHAIGDGLPPESITVDVSYSPADNSVYIVNGASGVIVIGKFKSSSMGVFQGVKKGQEYKWTKEESLPVEVKGFEPVSELTVDPNSGELYACTYLGLLKKTKGQWLLEFNENFIGGVIFEKGNYHRSIATTTDKLFIRKNGKWQQINNTPWNRYASVYHACFFNKAIFVGTNDGLFISRDSTGHWERVKLPGNMKSRRKSIK